MDWGSVTAEDLMDALREETRTVRVGNISDLAGEWEIREFFSFSGDIEHLEIRSDPGVPRTAFVTFKEAKALEIALLLSVTESGVSMQETAGSISEADLEQSRHSFSSFLSSHIAYELLPESGKVTALDVILPVKQAFHILYEKCLKKEF